MRFIARFHRLFSEKINLKQLIPGNRESIDSHEFPRLIGLVFIWH